MDSNIFNELFNLGNKTENQENKKNETNSLNNVEKKEGLNLQEKKDDDKVSKNNYYNDEFLKEYGTKE